MSDERGKILSFLQTRNNELIREAQLPPKAAGDAPLSFAVHSLAREQNILMTRPLFELALMHLWKGDQSAKELAQMLQQTTGITVPPWPL